MNYVDAIIIVILAISAFLGFKLGLIKTVVPLVGFLIAIALAGVLHDSLADKLGFIDNESWANIAAFAIIFVVVFVIVYILANIVRKIISLMFLGLVDRAAGAALGFIIAWLVCSMLVALVARYGALPTDLPEQTPDNIEAWVEENVDGARKAAYDAINDSALASFQLDTFPVILGLLPGQFDDAKDFFGD
ncbi:MAG: CvpA family protein [Dehalococcoidia bacterium]